MIVELTFPTFSNMWYVLPNSTSDVLRRIHFIIDDRTKRRFMKLEINSEIVAEGIRLSGGFPFMKYHGFNYMNATFYFDEVSNRFVYIAND